MPRKSLSPAQAKRAELAEHIRARGESAHNIWVVKPPFEDDIYLSSDSARELFYFIEGDARYREISYMPLRATTRDVKQRHENLRFAEVVTIDGRNWTVYLKRGSKSVDDTVSHRVDLAMLTASAMRIENWRRIIPCIRRVCLHPLALIECSVRTVLKNGQQRSIRQVLSAMENPSVPLSTGAIATMLRKRELISDCDSRPWSWQTLVGLRTP